MSAQLAPTSNNSRSQLLLDLIRKEFPSYHPLVSIARIAHNENAPLGLQFEAHKTVAKYVECELKSVEHKGHVEQRHTVQVSLFDPIDAEYNVIEPIIGNAALENW